MSSIARRKIALLAAVLSLAALLACNLGNQAEDVLPPLFAELAHTPLAMNPVQATAVGYHNHVEGQAEDGSGGTTVNLDELIGDYSSAGIQRRISFYKDFIARLHSPEDSVARDSKSLLDRAMWADYGVAEGRVKRALFNWETKREWDHNPNFYIEILGRALFTPLTLEYAPENERFGHIISRLGKVPEFLTQAKGNLQSTSELQLASAKGEVQGLISLVQRDIPARLPDSMKGEYDAAAGSAVEAMRDFSGFLDGLDTGADWRMGVAEFEEAIRAGSDDDDITLDGLLTLLQAEYEETYKDLIENARPLHRKIYGGQRAPSDFALMRDILDIVSDDNRLRSEDGTVDAVREGIDEARAFMADKDLVSFPAEVGLEVAQTPPFLRSTFPVAAFQAPPILEPKLGANFWLTPLPASADNRTLLAKLREYNNFKLKIVAVDAASRYLQSALNATGLPDETRRLLRNVDGNTAYVRGWSWYLVDTTMREGFNRASPEFQMNWFKYKLEFLASAILDIRLHAQNLSVADAQDMLRTNVFMEAGAVASAVRSIQLNPTTYAQAYFGANQWQRVKQRYQEITTDFSPTSFHGKALAEGPLAPPELTYLISDGQGRFEPPQ